MNKKIIIGVVVVLVVGLVVGYVVHQPATITTSKGIGTPTGFDNVVIIGGVRQGVPTSEFPVAPAVNTVIGNGLATLITSGSLSTGTSTLQIIANPFNATSTITQSQIQIIGMATTSSIIMGTTTATSGLTISNVTASLINTASIAKGSQVFVSGGITLGNSGYVSAGSGTVNEIVVGPLESVGIFASTTAGTYGNASVTSGVYTIEWQR